MKTLVRFFFATALLAATTLPLLAHNSGSAPLIAFRDGAEIYTEGPVPSHPDSKGRWPVPSTPQKPMLGNNPASAPLIAFRDGAEKYSDGPVPYHPDSKGRWPVPSTPQKPLISIG
jgi:hypothetical protein